MNWKSSWGKFLKGKRKNFVETVGEISKTKPSPNAYLIKYPSQKKYPTWKIGKSDRTNFLCDF